MRSEPTPEEKFAFRLLKAELGVTVDSSLEQRAPGQVDALLTYPNGDQAALEVTILCDPREAELWRLLRQRDYKWHSEESRLWWTVGLHPQTPLKQFNQHFKDAFQLYEQHGAVHPNVYLSRDVVASSPAVQWFEKHQVEVFGYTNVTNDPRRKGRHPGTINVTPAGRSGAVGNPEVVPRWLSEQAGIAHSQVRKKLDKLADSVSPSSTSTCSWMLPPPHTTLLGLSAMRKSCRLSGRQWVALLTCGSYRRSVERTCDGVMRVAGIATHSPISWYDFDIEPRALALGILSYRVLVVAAARVA